MEVKKAGTYKTRDGHIVSIYGFDDLGGGKMMAEGYFADTKQMSWWHPDTGEYDYAGHKVTKYDIVEKVG